MHFVHDKGNDNNHVADIEKELNEFASTAF